MHSFFSLFRISEGSARVLKVERPTVFSRPAARPKMETNPYFPA